MSNAKEKLNTFPALLTTSFYVKIEDAVEQGHCIRCSLF